MQMPENLKALGKQLGLTLLKSFRGLICEKKDGGWEMSKGAAMSWVLLYNVIQMGLADKLDPKFVFAAWAATMGYNGMKLVDIGGAFSKLRGG